MPKNYIVARAIRVPVWNQAVHQKALTFWTRRRMVFSDTSTSYMYAQRGSLWQNTYAFDCELVKSQLTITFIEPDSLDAVIAVDTRFQDMTDWTKAHFHLEMHTFESFLLFDDLQEQRWSSFKKGFYTAAATWLVTGMLFGRRMSREEWANYTQSHTDRFD